jgi:hypothetical protein
MKLANPLLLRSQYRGEQDHLFRAPLANKTVMSMDVVAKATWAIIARAEKILHSVSTTMEELQDLMEDTHKVDQKYSLWPDTQPREWRPKILGQMDDSNPEITEHPLYYAGPVETYFDRTVPPCSPAPRNPFPFGEPISLTGFPLLVYVATVWNTFRKGRLLMLELISQLAMRFEEHDLVEHCRAEARVLATGLIAAIPYFLSADPSAFLPPRSPGTSVGPIKPGRSVGGLLIVHPLYIASTFTVIDGKMRAHMLHVLSWIGEELAIGQATVLAGQPNDFQKQFLRDAHILVWAGMVNQPV